MSCHAVLPIKAFDRAKSRLHEALSPEERQRLATRCAEHVLSLLGSHRDIDAVIVCSDDDRVLDLARRHGATPLRDPEDANRLNEIVDAGLALAAARGAQRALVLMSDLPELATSDLDALLEGHQREELVLAPDRHGKGTNALVVTPPERMPTCFGHPESFALHRERAEALGVFVRIVETQGLGRDVDLADDLSRSEQSPARIREPG